MIVKVTDIHVLHKYLEKNGFYLALEDGTHLCKDCMIKVEFSLVENLVKKTEGKEYDEGWTPIVIVKQSLPFFCCGCMEMFYIEEWEK